MGLYSFHLFAGAGGGILADRLLGHKPVGAVEIETYPRKVLLARQLDGSLPRFPIWDDIKTFREDNPATGAYIRRLQEVRKELVICGGFPCQDISAAGKGAGIEGERSGLWVEMARVIREIRPRYAFVENSPILTSRGLGVVLGDLAEMGFDARWGVLGAADVGAPHLRERIWIVADAGSKLEYSAFQSKDSGKLYRVPTFWSEDWKFFEMVPGVSRRLTKWREMGGSCLVRGDDGLEDTLDRLKAIGNGQVPQCAAEAWRILSQEKSPSTWEGEGLDTHRGGA